MGADQGVGQHVLATTLHRQGERMDADFTFTHEGPGPGERAYWVRVKQSDFQRAWSSPFYIDTGDT
jgi:hypothetical protein